MPHHKGSCFGGRFVDRGYREVLHVLRVEVGLANVAVVQLFELFGKRPLGAVAPVDKGRQNGDTQIRIPGKKRLRQITLIGASNYSLNRFGT